MKPDQEQTGSDGTNQQAEEIYYSSYLYGEIAPYVNLDKFYENDETEMQ